MRKRFIVDLTHEELASLAGLLRKGVAPARKLTRARILLLADDGGAPSPPALATPEGSVRSGQSSPKPAPRTYVVRAGDTLTSIALRAYGNEGRWRAIYRANRALIRDPDVLVVGTTLTIP